MRLTGFIIKAAACFELLGALVMAPAFCREFGLARGMWYAVFHSISAFATRDLTLWGRRHPIPP